MKRDRHKLPPSLCLRCGYEIDLASGVKGGRPPRPGAIAICLNCGALAELDASLAMRPCGDNAAAVLALDAGQLELVRVAQTYIRRRGPIPRLAQARRQ